MPRKSRRAPAPERHGRLSAVDTAWLRMDGPGGAMMIVSVLTTATPVRAADLRRVFAKRLLGFPRFLQRPVPDALGAAWQDDAGFDLDEHFVVTDLAAPAGKTQLEDLVSRLASERLDPGRPLWQVHFVERFGPGSAWVLRVHHCYADGIAMIRVLLSLTGEDPGPTRTPARGPESPRDRPAPTAPAAGPLANWIDQVVQPAGDILGNVFAEAARLLESGVHGLLHRDEVARLASQAGGMIGEFARVVALPDDPATPFRAPLSGIKRVAWSAPLDLSEVKVVGKALGCTVNDVLMATVAGALGAYLRELRRFDSDALGLRASVPVNLRSTDEALSLGNKFGLVFVDLPVGTRNPIERVLHVHATMDALKGSLQPAMTLVALGTMGLLPAALQAPAIELFSRKGTLVASNVPGPQTPLRLCGQRIREMYFWVPQSGSIGLGFSLLSYAGQVFVGAIADRNVLPRPRRLVERFSREFERLVLATTVGVLGARRMTARDAQPARRRTTSAQATRRRPADTPAENT